MKTKIIYKLNSLNLYILQNCNYINGKNNKIYEIQTITEYHKINKHIFNLIVCKNINKMDLQYFSSNVNITPKLIEKFIDADWNWDLLSKNSNLTEIFIDKYFDKINIHNVFKFNSNSKYFSLNFLIKYFNKYKYLTYHYFSNKNITEEFLTKYVFPCKDITYDCFTLTNNTNISLNFIKKYNNYEWNFIHPRISLDVLKTINIHNILLNIYIVTSMIEDNNYYET